MDGDGEGPWWDEDPRDDIYDASEALDSSDADRLWKQKDGTAIMLFEMSDSHLEAAIAFLERRGAVLGARLHRLLVVEKRENRIRIQAEAGFLRQEIAALRLDEVRTMASGLKYMAMRREARYRFERRRRTAAVLSRSSPLRPGVSLDDLL